MLRSTYSFRFRKNKRGRILHLIQSARDFYVSALTFRTIYPLSSSSSSFSPSSSFLIGQIRNIYENLNNILSRFCCCCFFTYCDIYVSVSKCARLYEDETNEP